jgi:dTDP-4-dehydrorhamnose 3,5-epimerase
LNILATALPEVWVIEPTPQGDERGSFARTFCAREFAAQGLVPVFSQCSVSRNRRAGTLRGMHFQAEPYAEAKLVRCSHGAIYDVALDLRPHSPSYRRWFAVELSADNQRMLYVPPGCAHGFQTLSDDAEVYYQISTPFEATAARGVRWNDPAFGIVWPDCAQRIIATRDATYPDYV